jgi:cell division protein FtsI (penicillin-binding protein 3)
VFKKVADKLFHQDVELQRQLNLGGMPNNNFVPTQQVAKTNLLQKAYTDLGIKIKYVDSSSQMAKAVFNPDGSVSLIKVENKKGYMPDLRGYALRDALFILENRGIRVEIEGKGKVYYQSVRPNKGIGRGDKVLLKLK